MDALVQLNVGGMGFSTTVATLSSHPGILRDVVSGAVACQRDAEGRIFLDSDGTLFCYVLNFLRHGRFALPASFDSYPALHQTIAHLLPALPYSQMPQPQHQKGHGSPLNHTPAASSPPWASPLPPPPPPYASVGLKMLRLEHYINCL